MENNLNEIVENIITRLKNLVETETVIGKPITIKENVIIIPVSKISFGFGIGGNDSAAQKKNFQLGSGVGGSVTPIGFLVIKDESVEILEVGNKNQINNLINSIPDIYEKFSSIFKKNKKASQKECSCTKDKSKETQDEEKATNSSKKWLQQYHSYK